MAANGGPLPHIGAALAARLGIAWRYLAPTLAAALDGVQAA